MVAAGSTISRACRVLSIDRKTYHYQPKQQALNDKIKARFKALSAQYPHYGFKKLSALIEKQSITSNHKRFHRLYCELGLNLKIKPKKRLAPRTKQTLIQPQSSNICWSLDFMSDAMQYGRRFRTANVIDDYNREAMGIMAGFSLPAQRVTRWLDRLAETRGYPENIRVDNGPEYISSHFRSWTKANNINLKYIQPGKPAQNAYIERFNRSYREAILDMYMFDSIQQVQQLTNEWLHHYNHERPHEALNNMTPYEYAQSIKQNFLLGLG